MLVNDWIVLAVGGPLVTGAIIWAVYQIRQSDRRMKENSRAHEEWMYWHTESYDQCGASRKYDVVCSKCGVKHPPESDVERWKRERKMRLCALEQVATLRRLEAESRERN